MPSTPIKQDEPLFKLAKQLGLKYSQSSTLGTRRKEQKKGAFTNALYNARKLFSLGYFHEPDAENTRYVRVLRAGLKKSMSGNQVVSTTITKIPNEEPRVHNQTITVVPTDWNGPVSSSPGIKVYCECPRFKYMWDYALYTVGASDGLACEGIPSPVNNPRLQVAMCKHLLRITEMVLIRKV